MARANRASGEKPLIWAGSSKKIFLKFPDQVIYDISMALSVAQYGGKHPKAKSWKGEGAGVFEIVENFNKDTYRAVYTVRFAKAVYVLHTFQKKSPQGIKTARTDVELIVQRLKDVEKDYKDHYGKD